MLWSQNNSRCAMVATLCFAGWIAGCSRSAAVIEDNKNSGPDGFSKGAKLMYLNRTEQDTVSYPKRLRTKWKRIYLKPSGQSVLCVLRIDNSRAQLDLEMFDKGGSTVLTTTRTARQREKQLTVKIAKQDTYLLRVQAAKETDESDFSLRCGLQ